MPDYTPLAELRDLQLRRLQAVVTLAWKQVKLFRSRMDELGLAPEDIRSLDDVARLPFTQKSDLRDTYPFGLFASPMKRCCSPARLQRNYRKTDRRGLHAERY